ncbi:GCN5-like N-acetyltransferase [Rostrohypoxylon terebratum]|nr:GCN5-like N-acetyltransferase [Rostrohypoxylon terebratum]
MEPRRSSAAPAGSVEEGAVPAIVRQISARQTYALRHAVLWPDKPASYVQLPDDEVGLHYGAFVSGGELPGCHHDRVEGDGDSGTENTNQDNDSSAKREDNASHDRGSGDELASVISLFVDSESGDARFRKFATAKHWQRRGLGSVLLAHVVEAAASRGATRIWCDARQSALPFYRRFGFSGEEGTVFYKGDVPYLRMSRSLP